MKSEPLRFNCGLGSFSEFFSRLIINIDNVCYCNSFFSETDFLDKKLEIGDISIIICAKDEKAKKGAITILTDDQTFALISDKKHDLITIYYPEIRTASLILKKENIPKEYLEN